MILLDTDNLTLLNYPNSPRYAAATKPCQAALPSMPGRRNDLLRAGVGRGASAEA